VAFDLVVGDREGGNVIDDDVGRICQFEVMMLKIQKSKKEWRERPLAGGRQCGNKQPYASPYLP